MNNDDVVDRGTAVVGAWMLAGVTAVAWGLIGLTVGWAIWG